MANLKKKKVEDSPIEETREDGVRQVQIPEEYVNAIIQAQQKSNELVNLVLSKAVEQTRLRNAMTEIKESISSNEKELDKLNVDRENLQKTVQDIITRAENVCRLDREVNWTFDVSSGYFIENGN